MLGFKTSSNLAAAYGIAVTGTMAITTMLFHRVARDLVALAALACLAAHVAVHLRGPRIGANIVKVEEGGWFPLAAAAFVFTLLSTKRRARSAEMMREAGLPLDVFLDDIARRKPQRVPGTAVFMTGNTGTVPPVLLHHLKHNKVLHERVVLTSIMSEEIPSVRDAERVTVKELGSGFFQVIARYGFMETPDVPAMLTSLPHQGRRASHRAQPMETTYYLGPRRCCRPAPPRCRAGASASSS